MAATKTDQADSQPAPRGSAELETAPAASGQRTAPDFWQAFFQLAKRHYAAPRMIDIASGHGGVLERALGMFGEDGIAITCADPSAAAVNGLCRRFPRLSSVQADAWSIPLPAGSFDLVTSQFGIDCSRMEAIDEAARLLQPDGCLAMLVNHRDSAAFRQAAVDLEAISRLQQAEFMPLARQLFSTAFAACQGADRAAYEAAARRFVPALRAAESVLSQYGEAVAGGAVARLYSDLDRMHGNLQRYETDQVLEWLRGMEAELQNHAQGLARLASSTLDPASFGQLCEALRQRGFTLVHSGPLQPADGGEPLAWAVVAARGNALADSTWPAGEMGDTEQDSSEGPAKLQAWVRKQVSAAVSEITRKGVFNNLLVEAKPAWVLPFQIVIGKVRERGQQNDFDWFICGATPTDQAHSQAAATPREAARYFALKWQRDAVRQPALDTPVEGAMPAQQADGAAGLARQAEALYALVEDPRVWPEPE